jgi:hypothetical protein
MSEKKTYPYYNEKFYWVYKKEHFGKPLLEIARFDDGKEYGLSAEFYLTGSEEGIIPEYFDKIFLDPIPKSEI